jgi:ribose transport system permease protein
MVLLVTYVICGFLSAVAGLILEGAINGVDLSLGDVYLLPSVAAVVIGGTTIYGGHGGYAGSLVGALILTVLSSLFTLLDAPDPVKQILYGAIVVLLAALYVRTAGDAR